MTTCRLRSRGTVSREEDLEPFPTDVVLRLGTVGDPRAVISDFSGKEILGTEEGHSITVELDEEAPGEVLVMISEDGEDLAGSLYLDKWAALQLAEALIYYAEEA